MILSYGQIKCDSCGAFVKADSVKYKFQPDCEFNAEDLESYHIECLEEYK